MSKIAFDANDQGTGVLTIASPDTNNDRTLTLPDETGTVLTSAGGALGALKQADMYRITTDVTANGYITSNWERPDDPSFGYIGGGITESSGVFSFPQTGTYLIFAGVYAVAIGGDNVGFETYVTLDNSSYDAVMHVVSASGGSSTVANHASGLCLVNVSNISNTKVRFYATSISSGSAIVGNTSQNQTHVAFIRLGDAS